MEFEDGGFLDMTVVAQDGTRVTVTLDVWSTWSKVYKAARKVLSEGTRDDDEYVALVQEIMTKLGFPQVSEWAALQFAGAVKEAVEGLKKKEWVSTKPASPGSTESTPGS